MSPRTKQKTHQAPRSATPGSSLVREIVDSKVQTYYLKDDGTFPNSRLPVVFYRHAFDLPFLFSGYSVRNRLRKNGWKNFWRAGIYTFHHYHSNNHEILVAIHGRTNLLIGGEHGIKLVMKRGDALLLPAGTAHKNIGKENDITCIGGYSTSEPYDVRRSSSRKRPHIEINILKVPIPKKDPVLGMKGGIRDYWIPDEKILKH